MTATAVPTEVVLSGRRADGTFAPGHGFSKGIGRPKGFDLRRVAAEHAAKNGVDLELALWEILFMQIQLAKAGDAAAVKVVLSTLGDAVNTDEVAESLAEVIAATITKNRARLSNTS